MSDEGDDPCVSDRHATAWDALYVPSIPAREDPNQAPTEVATSTHDVEEGEIPSVPETPHSNLIKETHLQKNQPWERLRVL